MPKCDQITEQKVKEIVRNAKRKASLLNALSKESPEVLAAIVDNLKALRKMNFR